MLTHKGKLTTALNTVLSGLEDAARTLPPPKLAELVIAAYELLEKEDGFTLLEQSIEQAEKLMAAANGKYTPSQKAKIISLVFQELSEGELKSSCFKNIVVYGNVGSQVTVKGNMIQHGVNFNFGSGDSILTPGQGVVGNGDPGVEVRELGVFSALIVDGPICVQWSRSQNQSVEVQGDSNIIPLITTEVRGSVLHITCDGSFSTVNSITVRCSAKEILSANLKGSGDIEIQDLQQKEVELFLKGSGNIDITGTVSIVKATLKGSGNIDCSTLVAHSAEVLLKGSGDIKVSCFEKVTAVLKGSGDIKIYGKPEVQNVKELGSGRVKFK